MQRVTASEVRTGVAYEQGRQQSRDALVSAQSQRRVALGDELVLVFESRETVRAALEELLRVERGDEQARVGAALDAFNALLPSPGQLLATLILDTADAAALGDRSAALKALPAGLSLDVAGTRAPARPRDAENLQSGAVSVIFELPEQQRVVWLSGGPVTAVVDHPSLSIRAALSPAQVAAIGGELSA